MNTDDPKFTAFALDELSPEERAEIQAALDQDPTLSLEMDNLRRFAAGLREELHAEGAAPLTEQQRAAVLGLAVPPPANIIVPHRSWWRTPWIATAAAACVVGGLATTIYFQAQYIERLKAGQEVARQNQPVLGMPLKLQSEELLATAPAEAPSLDIAGPKPVQLDVGQNAALSWKNQPGAIRSSDWGGLNGSTPLSASATPVAAELQPSSQPSASTVAVGDITSPVSGEMLVTAAKRRALDKSSLTLGRQTAGGGAVEALGGRSAASKPRAGTIPDPAHYYNGSAIDGRLGAVAPEALGRQLKELEVRLKVVESESTPGLADRDSERAELRQTIDQTRRTLERIQETQEEPSNTEAYDEITDNPFMAVKENPLSTFSIDVDSASYTNVRRFLESNQRPPKGAVRIEELVNYFRYDYPQPEGKDPFACAMEVATCPWAPDHRLVRVGLKGREIAKNQRPPANLVFLIDVSGSMEPANKLPLVKESLRLLTDQLGENDSVAIAVYAGASGCVLEPTHDKDKVRAALDRLGAGGSTNGAAGIQLAYDLAQRAFKKGGSNRVILCTDGDFNVGVSDQSQLVSMIQDKAKTGVFLSVLGFGFGNLKDSTLEKLADKGNGFYGYIDTLAEGRRLFVEQMAGTLVTIAKDVKIQMEFNPAKVAAYRLIGYENRLLAKEDFNDDKKDAGEIGAGHTVTALYEIVPAGKESPVNRAVDELKYQPSVVAGAAGSPELLTLKVRYKQPDGDVSTKLEFPLTDNGATWEKSSNDFRWAAAVAGFGMLLRDSPHRGSLSWSLVDELTSDSRADKSNAERAQFVQLLEKARALSR